MDNLDSKFVQIIDDNYKLGFHDDLKYSYISKKGLRREVVEEISKIKNEPEFMKDFRLKAYEIFLNKKMPEWIASEKDLKDIKFDDIFYYLQSTDKQEKSWDDVPDAIKKTFDKIGVPQAEREFLGGVKSQYDSTVVYGSLLKELEDQGVIFLGTDEALKKYPEIFKQYFGTVVPPADNKFSALNSAVWSGGSFVYIPKGVHVKRPLQAYFRINAENAGQFERTLIIAEEDSFVSYVEGCFTAGHFISIKGGYRKIEEVMYGDEVLTHKGNYKKVYEVQKRFYTGDLYLIKLKGVLKRIKVTEEHPFLTIKQEWVNACALNAGDLLISPMPKNLKAEGSDTSYYEIEEIQKKKTNSCAVFNFSVEEDESYVVNGVAVHNCSAPSYSSGSLHSAVVEIIVKKGARVRYTTIQNWYKNVYNLVTKRAIAHEDAVMEWVDGNIGSRLTVKFPSVYLVGERARGEILSIAYAGEDQHQHTGGKVIHAAKNTFSRITSKSISSKGGRTSYRGLVEVNKGCTGSKSRVECDALILDNISRTDTYPVMKINESKVNIEHEASVSKVGDEQLFYLQSRGLTRAEAMNMVVSGFMEPIVKELPLEYAVELNKLIEMEMEGSVG